jgi:hypothetical protein
LSVFAAPLDVFMDKNAFLQLIEAFLQLIAAHLQLIST